MHDFGPGLEDIVLSGYPTQAGVREFGHSQSEKVRREPPNRTLSFGNRRGNPMTAHPSLHTCVLEAVNPYVCKRQRLYQYLEHELTAFALQHSYLSAV